ncbi:MAG: carboxymuconolactone decarboxylase family protein [Atopobiaceae bacterium]|jgi:4-carboxymuconolactone decarboxylase|nr:carboxymuconolactone decarboxylase family protein [Atopobiaceae bacterium]MCI2173796.1 carboxymuconolactone decarboxylase family protein [Atopobiaceae bacterium]MCI2207562.1 carboxymuconolactone decarboxylase family protein [Atopobiaceae bacterium]
MDETNETNKASETNKADVEGETTARCGGPVADRVEACERKFAELFGGTPNAGEGDDPELMQILQRFIFGEVSYTGTLPDHDRELVTCVVLATYQTLPQLTAHATAALNVGVTPMELREAMYGCMPFIGCPKTLNAVSTIDAVLTSRGFELPLPSAATVADADRLEAGAAIQAPVYGDEIRDAMAWLPDGFDEAVPRFLTEDCFGDFHTRDGLDERLRNLLELVVLVALGGCESQVAAHARGCLKTGSSTADVLTAIVQALPYTGIPRALNAIRAMRPALGQD